MASKYNNKKVKIDDIKFDSGIEGQYYLKLKQEKTAGGIKEFSLQPEFILQPKCQITGKSLKAIKLKADFRVINNDGTVEIIDVKGLPTAVSIMKRKMYDFTYREPLIWISWSVIDGGWIEYDKLKINRKFRREIKHGLRCFNCEVKRPREEIKPTKEKLKKMKKEGVKPLKIHWLCEKCSEA